MDWCGKSRSVKRKGVQNLHGRVFPANERAEDWAATAYVNCTRIGTRAIAAPIAP